MKKKTDIAEQIGAKVAAARKVSGLTQADLAKKMKVTQGYIAQVERGNNNDIGVAVLSRIAAALGAKLKIEIER